MYEVFINNKRLVFDYSRSEHHYGTGWKKYHSISNSIDPLKIAGQLLDGTFSNNVVVCSSKPASLRKLFFEGFRFIRAAGGLVKNKNNQLLMIFRNEHWDLPKGKMETGEKAAEAALREVEEETGVVCHKRVKALGHTFHVYRLKKELILKQTTWYVMFSGQNQGLSPQADEGITAVKWMNEEEVNKALINSYPLIASLINKSRALPGKIPNTA